MERRSSGFSLPELLVVVAILAILASVATGSLSGRSRQMSAQILAREVFALANQARMTAVSSRKQAWIRMGDGDPAVALRIATVTGNGALNTSDWGPVEATTVARGGAKILGVDVGASFSSAPPSTPMSGFVDVIFYPSGLTRVSPSSTNGATVYITDNLLYHPQRIVLFGRTGFAKVLDR